jgi:molybdate transport system ATP-binding protein
VSRTTEPAAANSATTLRAEMLVTRGDRPGGFTLDAALTVAPGEVVAVLGPSGAGKSTLLAALAGLVPLRSGTVTLGGRTLEDTATGLRVPPELRPIGVVFQDYLLFPHLSALDNVAFGLRARGAGSRGPHIHEADPRAPRTRWPHARGLRTLGLHTLGLHTLGLRTPGLRTPGSAAPGPPASGSSPARGPRVLRSRVLGPRARGLGRAEARRLAGRWLERVGLADYAAARPDALSGGQAQRVALARALATGPEMLLLDEPLSALDVATRADVRRDLRRALAAFPGVRLMVTHDPTEAFALADRLIIIENGRVVQSGRPAEVTARPRSDYVARVAGVNLLRGHADGRRVTVTGDARADGGSHGISGATRASDPAETSEASRTSALAGAGGAADPSEIVVARPASGPVFVSIHPRAVTLHPADRPAPEGSARNVLRGTVRRVDVEGDVVRVDLATRPAIVAEVTPATITDLGIGPGSQVWATVKATEVETYPA